MTSYVHNPLSRQNISKYMAIVQESYLAIIFDLTMYWDKFTYLFKFKPLTGKIFYSNKLQTLMHNHIVHFFFPHNSGFTVHITLITNRDRAYGCHCWLWLQCLRRLICQGRSPPAKVASHCHKHGCESRWPNYIGLRFLSFLESVFIINSFFFKFASFLNA